MIYGVHYNAVDFAALLLVALAIFLGWRRGLALALFRLLCTLVIIVAALRLHQPLGALLAHNATCLASDAAAAEALAFALIVMTLGLTCTLLFIFLRLLLTLVFNPKINRPLGLLAGGLQGLALAFLLIYAVGLWPAPGARRLFAEQSLAGRTAFRVCPRVTAAIDRIEIQATIRPAGPEAE